MTTHEIANGSRIVRINESETGRCNSRLWVNGGETATLVSAKHSTLAGAKKWAAKALNDAR